MSGGSYEYLCLKDADQIFGGGWNRQLQEMTDRLAGLGYAPDAALETQEVLLEIRQVQNRLEARIRRLGRVWRAVEWWDSGDWKEESVHEALAEYRGQDCG